MPLSLACLRAHVPCVLACSRANVPCVLTCQRALRAYVLTCQRALRVYVLTCQGALRAWVLTCQGALRAYVLTCQCALRTNWHLALRVHVQKVSTGLFFLSKLIFCPDEKSLLIKVETRRVTRNASRHNESFKILTSQIHLGFAISLINNRCGSCQTHKKRFFAKILNGLMSVYYFFKILHIRCLTVM